MKLLIILFLFISAHCVSQKFEFVFAIGPTLSLTNDNVSFVIDPIYNPDVLIEDPRSHDKFDSKSIDWIQTNNYFGFEPSVEMGYRLGEGLLIGLGFFGRHRQLKYDVYLPSDAGSSIYSHTYKLNFNFVATTMSINFINKKEDINIGLNLGFNYPLNKLDEYYTYDQVFNQFNIRESVTAPVKGSHNTASFTLNPLIKLNIYKYLNDKFNIGFSVEKQIKNDYGSYINIIDTSTSETILNGSVLGSDLTFGFKVGYRLSL